jgi:hypothetical protein
VDSLVDIESDFATCKLKSKSKDPSIWMGQLKIINERLAKIGLSSYKKNEYDLIYHICKSTTENVHRCHYDHEGHRIAKVRSEEGRHGTERKMKERHKDWRCRERHREQRARLSKSITQRNIMVVRINGTLNSSRAPIVPAASTGTKLPTVAAKMAPTRNQMEAIRPRTSVIKNVIVATKWDILHGKGLVIFSVTGEQTELTQSFVKAGRMTKSAVIAASKQLTFNKITDVEAFFVDRLRQAM